MTMLKLVLIEVSKHIGYNIQNYIYHKGGLDEI